MSKIFRLPVVLSYFPAQPTRGKWQILKNDRTRRWWLSDVKKGRCHHPPPHTHTHTLTLGECILPIKIHWANNLGIPEVSCLYLKAKDQSDTLERTGDTLERAGSCGGVIAERFYGRHSWPRLLNPQGATVITFTRNAT